MKLPEEMQAALDAAEMAFPGVSVHFGLGSGIWHYGLASGPIRTDARYSLRVTLPVVADGKIKDDFTVVSEIPCDLVTKAREYIAAHALPAVVAAALRAA